MALRLQCGVLFCCEDRLVGRRQWLRRISPAKSWWAVGGTLPAVAITAKPRVGNTTAVCPIDLDPGSGTARVAVNAVTRPCREGIYDDGKEDGRKRCGGRAPASSEKVDQWMQRCIVEIVRHIGEAPFLVHVFCTDQGPTLKLEVEAADPESWCVIRKRWDRGVATRPDGIILVEELKGEQRDGGRATTASTTTTWDGGDGDGSCFGAAGSKTWGIVVQGCGADCAACYILSTCRVRSTLGFCTHFCLTRARCFGDTADAQLKKLWLVGMQDHQQQQ